MVNRNNYEEYLLMYLDGELSSSDRKAVEVFLEENPDLKKELQLLQQTILPAEENIGFTGKESLYRQEEGISLHNYQAYFLLYIDNELSVSEKQAVETFVLQQPQLQDQFTLLKQTVLPTEHIVFSNKASLYRTEEKRRPVVVSLRWASLAAAVMIGIMVFVIFYKNTGDSIPPVAVQPGNTNPVATPGDKGQRNIIPATQGVNTTIASGVNTSTGNKITAQPLKEQVKDIEQPQEPVANQPNYQDEQIAVTTTLQPPVQTSITNTITTIPVTAGEEKIIAAGSTGNTNNPYQHAVYTDELDTEKDNNLYVGSLQVNTDKVRGFFRKASRFLSNKVKGNDDGNGKIKVANIEMNKIK